MPSSESSSSRSWMSLTALAPDLVAPAGRLARVRRRRRLLTRIRRRVGLLSHPKLGRGIPERSFRTSVDELVDRRVGRVALEPPRPVVGARVGAVVRLAVNVQPELLEHHAIVLGLGPEGGEEIPHHHPVEACLDGEGLEVAEVLDAPAAEAEEGLRKDQAEDRYELHRLPRVDQLPVAEFRARARVEEIDRDAGRVHLGELERHLDPLLPSLAQIEDAAYARLEAGLLDGGDGPHPSLVLHGGGDLVVVAPSGLDVVVDSLDPRLAELLRA